MEAFYRIVEHPALRGLPMILETPNELPGYAAEIARLRKRKQIVKIFLSFLTDFI